MKSLKLLVLVLIAVGCSSEEDLIILEKFAVVGRVTSVTETPLSAVTITFQSKTYPDSVHTVATAADGTFSIRLSIGDYRMEVNRDGYTTRDDLVTVSSHADSLRMTLTGNADVFGNIIDSQTGNGLSSVTVTFTRNGLPELILTTNDTGRFQISGAPTGNFSMTAVQDGFFTRSVEDVTLQEGPNELANAIAVSKPKKGEIRIVLSWGEYPLDLDSHLTGPSEADNTKRFHVYWDNKNPEAAVSLDVDDVLSYGPETITINHLVQNHIYYYYVHNYQPQNPSTSCTEMVESPAVVEVYDETGLIGRFTPSLGAAPTNNLWIAIRILVGLGENPNYPSAVFCNSIFCIDVPNGYRFVPLNQEGNSDYIFRRNGKSKQKIDLPDLP